MKLHGETKPSRYGDGKTFKSVESQDTGLFEGEEGGGGGLLRAGSCWRDVPAAGTEAGWRALARLQRWSIYV